MSISREKSLLSGGYRRIRCQDIAIPHTVWTVSVDVEFDRTLKLAEETVLGLVALGVSDYKVIADLMGLDADVIVTQTVVTMLQAGQLDDVAGLRMTKYGGRCLERRATRDVRTYDDLDLRRNRYGGDLVWDYDGGEESSRRSLSERGIDIVPAPSAFTQREMERHGSSVQELLGQFGFPFDNHDVKSPQSREICALRAERSREAYRIAELEVWEHEEHKTQDFRVVLSGGELTAVEEFLRESGYEAGATGAR